jgi:hypothetical protein
MENELSLQAFHEALERYLSAYSADELRTVLRAMARATPPERRAAFLEDVAWVAHEEEDAVGPGFDA